MRYVHFVIAALLAPTLSWAGTPVPVAVQPSAPLMNDGGLVMLALALGGTGIALLRGRGR
jgi:hypothetical protein